MKLQLLLTSRDIAYAPAIKPYVTQFLQSNVSAQKIGLRSELQMAAKGRGCTHIATTSFSAFKLCDPTLEGTAADNYGAVALCGDLPIVLLPELSCIHTVPHGWFLIKRYLRKLSHPQEFMAKSKFTWRKTEPATVEADYDWFASCKVAAVDIETSKENLFITCCAYSGINSAGYVRNIVFDFTGRDADYILYMMQWLRRFNALPVPKIFQNGEYDNSYFLRWNMPVTNYLFDTYNMMHCMYSELDKDLASLSSFWLSNFRFWKDESASNLLEYNAKDAHNTLFVFLAMMAELPKLPYARQNYLLEFPIVFPCLHSGMEGIKVDEVERGRLKAEAELVRDTARSRLFKVIHPKFNAGSSQQVLKLVHAMGFTRASGTDKKNMQAFAESHPLNQFLKEIIESYRKSAKAVSTYYEYDLLGGRLLYKLDPAGTDTGRLAAKSSSFWCGTQIQNQPPYCKSMYVADDGWLLSEIDNSQSESRTTAYLAQDLALINSVETSPDFHCTNASLFFGIPFAELFDTATGKKLNKPIRDLAKRVNHGANYNMGWSVLSETMGTANVFRAKKLLKLSDSWGVKKICEHLLSCFDRTYPRVRGAFQQEVMHEIETTGKLTLPNGWTRRTFLRPKKNKHELNSAVAHKPQSLSVMLINKAFFRVWLRLQLDRGSETLRLKAQIHDAILSQIKIGHEYVADEISEMMKIPCTVHGRTFIIPNDVSFGGKRWSDLKD